MFRGDRGAILVRYKPMSEILKPSFVHDHGKWMLAFVMVWAYFSFSQWLIIWAGNLPEEISWYMTRLSGGWLWVGLALVLFHFAVPFALLLSRPFKRDMMRLVVAGGVAAGDVLRGSVLDHRAELLGSFPDHAGGCGGSHRHGWFVAGHISSAISTARPLLPLYDPSTREILEPAHE